MEETKNRIGLRYLIVRNLVLPTSFSVWRHGLFVEIESKEWGRLHSEIAWGAKDAMWLLGEGALGSSPFVVRIYLAEASDGHIPREAALVDAFTKSTLANPLRRCDSVDGIPRCGNHKLVLEQEMSSLVPLNNATTRDLVHLPLPADAVLFSTEHFGKLFASVSAAQAILPLWGMNLSVILDRSAEITEEADAAFSRFVSLLGVQTMAEIIKCTDRLFAARDANVQLRRQSAELLQSQCAQVSQALSRKRKQELKRQLEIRHETLLAQVEELRNRAQKMEADIKLLLQEDRARLQTQRQQRELCQRALEIERNHIMRHVQLSSRYLMGRRLVVASEVLAVYHMPHSLNSTQIRDVNLESPLEDERAAALGYLAHLISVLAALFDVNLRYTPVAFGSRSFIMDNVFFVPVMDSSSSSHVHRVESLSATSALSATSGLYPLFSLGVERGAKRKCDTATQLLLIGINQLVETVRTRLLLTKTHSRMPERTISSLGTTKQGLLISEGLARLKYLLADLRLFPPYERSGTTNVS